MKRSDDAYLFSPAEADKERREKASQHRKTPLSCGNRQGTNRRTHPKRVPRQCYDVDSYRRAIARACDKAFPVSEEFSDEARKQWRTAHRWHPHQLRHNTATFLRREFGIDAAKIILGHRSLAVTEIYAELDQSKAIEIMKQVG